MKCFYCPAPACMHLVEVFSQFDFSHRDFCARCGEQRLQQLSSEVSGWAAREPAKIGDAGARFLITFLMIDEQHESQIVVLQEAGGRRTLPLVIGTAEVATIERRLKHTPHPRPLTHDAWARTIMALNADLQDVVFAELRDNVFYARLRLNVIGPPSDATTAIQPAGGNLSRPGGTAGMVEIDVRPSDALAMALVENVPIFVSEQLLQTKAALDLAHRHGTLEAAIPGENAGSVPSSYQEPPPVPGPNTAIQEETSGGRKWWEFWK